MRGLATLATFVTAKLTGRVYRFLALRSYGFFDADFYLSQIPTSAWTVRDPIAHYLAVGAERGLSPHPLFDPNYYGYRNPDVAKTGGNPLLHYLLFGSAAGCNPHPVLDESPAVIRNLFHRHSSYQEAFWKKYPRSRKWYAADNPRVSIIVLAFHNSELTTRCLDSIWQHTEGATYEVIVLDNGSNVEEIMAVTSHLYAGRLVALHVNRGFGEGNNIAADYARGEYLFFLNNDAYVTENWLDPLLEVFRSHSDAGAVGAKLLYPDGTLQEAGGMILESGVAVQIGKGDNASKPNYNVVTPVDYCSAAALLVQKDLYERILGFDHRFDPAYYEDADLGFKLRELGYKVYFCPTSAVVHQESASATQNLNLRLQNVVETNKVKFLQKWQPLLPRASFSSVHSGERPVGQPELPQPGVRHFVAEGANLGARQRVGIYTPYAVVPGGGERYLLSIAELLSERECLVDLVTPHKYSTLRIASIAGELRLDIAQLRLRTLTEVERDRPYDIFMCIGNEVVPPVCGHGVRNFYVCQFPFPVSRATFHDRREWFEQYEAAWVYSDFCAKHFTEASKRSGFDPIPTRVVPPPVMSMGDGSEHRKERMILTVGRFFVTGHNKKQLEMVRAFRELCDQGLEGWTFHLAGAVHEEYEHREYFLKVLDEARDYPVTIHANASPNALEELYVRSSIYWHATGLGEDIRRHPERHEHFGITTVEAMSAGAVPVVLGTGGACEVVEEGTSGFLWNTADELIERTKTAIRLHEQNDLETLRANARSRAATFDVTQFRRHIAKALGIEQPRGNVPMTKRRLPLSADGKAEFTCNVCGAFCSADPGEIHREIPSCEQCGSTVRFRSIVHVLSAVVFGESLPLEEFPTRKDLRGLGMSDWETLAKKLESRFEYVNTFYHQNPRLDISHIDDSMIGQYDFIISSDVFEHVMPPVSRAFGNTFRLLKPGGFLLLTVPYRAEGDTIEHFPDLHESRLERIDGRYRLLNRTRDGTDQVFEDLTFHGGEGATLELRIFGLAALESQLRDAGFQSVEIWGDDYAKYGVHWPDRDNLPIVARKLAARD